MEDALNPHVVALEAIKDNISLERDGAQPGPELGTGSATTWYIQDSVASHSKCRYQAVAAGEFSAWM